MFKKKGDINKNMLDLNNVDVIEDSNIYVKYTNI